VAPAAGAVIVHRPGRQAAAPAAGGGAPIQGQAHQQPGPALILDELQVDHPGAPDPQQALE
jgi:hypothetical protein